MAPGRRQHPQQPAAAPQPVESDSAAAEQLTKLLERLAAAPDLTLFKEKCERLKQLLCRHVYDAQQAAQLCPAAALATGLQHLQPYWASGCNLDLPEKPIYSIIYLELKHSVLVRAQAVQQEQQSQEVPSLVAAAAEGGCTAVAIPLCHNDMNIQAGVQN
jgi:hypothetical protein